MEQLKDKILESITPEEFHLVEKIHENSYNKSFELRNDIYKHLMNSSARIKLHKAPLM